MKVAPLEMTGHAHPERRESMNFMENSANFSPKCLDIFFSCHPLYAMFVNFETKYIKTEVQWEGQLLACHPRTFVSNTSSSSAAMGCVPRVLVAFFIWIAAMVL